MKFLLSLIGFIFLLFTVGMAVLVWKVRMRMKSFGKAFRDSMDDESFRRMADKHYYRNRSGNNESPFDDDYFKGSPNSGKDQQQQKTRRTTRTASGVTIIDDRTPGKRDKKIFAQDEGEYVDYVEN